MAKVTVQVPRSLTFAADDKVYREGEVFDVERDELVDAHIRNGNLDEVKKTRKR